MIRIWGVAALAVGLWLVAAYGQHRPVPLGAGAPATEFSAARAGAVLGRILGSQNPHPMGSAEAAKVQARILAEFAALGIPARTRTTQSCYAEPGWPIQPCGLVTNIIAPILPGQGPAIVLMAHSDSVAAGPGAADDGSGVAVVLETARALKARGGIARNPVVAVITDGEEVALLGAAAWLRDPGMRIGAVINLEARGNQGPSYLFQTSTGNAGLIDLYARATPYPAASSLYGEIYRVLPNDTDLTPVLRAGIAGVNFAFIGHAVDYHTARDRRENLSPASLQHQGDNMLAMAAALAHADPARLHTVDDAIYQDVLGAWLPRLPLRWALPLSLLALALVILAAWATPRGRRDLPRPLRGFLMPPLLVAGAVGMGFVLHGLAAAIAHHAGFAYPVWMRLSLGAGVFAAALVAARGAGQAAGWLWFALLAVACAQWAPGVTPVFLFPVLVAAPLLLASIRRGRRMALTLAALPALALWMQLNQGTEPVMGLALHPVFTVTAAFALVPLLPLLKVRQGFGVSLAVAVVAALGLAVVAGIAG